jgi:hypothetical protein
MWSHQSWNLKNRDSQLRKRWPLLDQNFQWKFVYLLFFAAGLATILMVAPMYYFTIQNYKIFTGLSYEQAPELLQHLEREQMSMNTFLVCSIVTTFLFCLVLGLRLSMRIVAPIKLMKSHLRRLSRGEWHGPPLKVRTTDEFQDLVETYNYFYQAFRIQIQNDLHLLQKMSIDPKNRDAFQAWQSLIDEKKQQLNIATNVSNASDSKPLPDQRHVS